MILDGQSKWRRAQGYFATTSLRRAQIHFTPGSIAFGMVRLGALLGQDSIVSNGVIWDTVSQWEKVSMS